MGALSAMSRTSKYTYEHLRASGVGASMYYVHTRRWCLLGTRWMRVRKVLLLHTLTAFAQWPHSLHTTRNAWYFHHVCSSRAVTVGCRQQCPPTRRQRRASRTGTIWWSVVCIFGFCSWANRLCWLKYFIHSFFPSFLPSFSLSFSQHQSQLRVQHDIFPFSYLCFTALQFNTNSAVQAVIK